MILESRARFHSFSCYLHLARYLAAIGQKLLQLEGDQLSLSDWSSGVPVARDIVQMVLRIACNCKEKLPCSHM
jgi:hypothetical protein